MSPESMDTGEGSLVDDHGRELQVSWHLFTVERPDETIRFGGFSLVDPGELETVEFDLGHGLFLETEAGRISILLTERDDEGNLYQFSVAPAT